MLEDIRDGVDNPTLYLKLVERAAPLLVPIMLETLTKQQVHLALPAPSCSSVFDLMLLHCPVLFCSWFYGICTMMTIILFTIIIDENRIE